MANDRSAKIEQVHLDEAKLLKALFDERAALSQEKFGLEYEIGSQGMVWQYLNAKSPLNLQAASKFAKGLHCEIADFSPRLDQERSELAPGAARPAGEQSAMPQDADAAFELLKAMLKTVSPAKAKLLQAQLEFEISELHGSPPPTHQSHTKARRSSSSK